MSAPWETESTGMGNLLRITMMMRRTSRGIVARTRYLPEEAGEGEGARRTRIK